MSKKISFCTTCMGRLEHLKQTLPENLKNSKSGQNEIVILAYGDQEAFNWVAEIYPAELETGEIKLAYIPAKSFKVGHAKNVAHRLGTGDILVNLDADNIIGPEFPKWLEEEFTKNPDIIVRRSLQNTFVKKLGGNSFTGIAGRIAISRDRFLALNGYKESHGSKGFGYEDGGLMTRALQTGSQFIPIPLKHMGKVITHDNKKKLVKLSDDIKSTANTHFESRRKKQICQLFKNFSAMVISGTWSQPLGIAHTLKKPYESVNNDGDFGCGTVRIYGLDSNIILEKLNQNFLEAAQIEFIQR